MSNKSIPFVALFSGPGARDRAQQAFDNPHTPPELRAELGRYLTDLAHAAAVDQEKLIAEADAKAAPFQGGKRPTKQVQYIRELVEANPSLMPRELWDIHVPAKIIPMTETNFLKRASEIRSEVRKRK
jgi:hypothetical protein